jgi:hypothetical protein
MGTLKSLSSASIILQRKKANACQGKMLWYDLFSEKLQRSVVEKVNSEECRLIAAMGSISFAKENAVPCLLHLCFVASSHLGNPAWILDWKHAVQHGRYAINACSESLWPTSAV